VHCCYEGHGIQELAFEGEYAGAEGVVGRFREVVGFWVVLGRRRWGACGQLVGGLGKQVGVDVCDAAEGAWGGGYFRCEVD
jgi:hypothetical protein